MTEKKNEKKWGTGKGSKQANKNKKKKKMIRNRKCHKISPGKTLVLSFRVQHWLMWMQERNPVDENDGNTLDLLCQWYFFQHIQGS